MFLVAVCMQSVSVENKFDALQASPSEEGKSWEGSRGSMKDDMKQVRTRPTRHSGPKHEQSKFPEAHATSVIS